MGLRTIYKTAFFTKGGFCFVTSAAIAIFAARTNK